MKKFNPEGPCLPWCFTYNENKYLLIGFTCGILVGSIITLILLILHLKNKSKLDRKEN